MDDPLLDALVAAALGRLPQPCVSLRVLPAPPGPAMAVVGLPGTHIVASSAPEAWVRERLTGDLMGPLSPAFLVELGARLGRADDGLDLLLAAQGLPGEPALRQVATAGHPRIARAAAHRASVRTFTDAAGDATVVLGRGLAGRLEVAVEVAPTARGRGVARRALLEARRLVDPEQALFAQVAPANAASIRSLLAAGFAPVGAEVLFFVGERAVD